MQEKFRKEFASRVPCLRILDRTPEPSQNVALPQNVTSRTVITADTNTSINHPTRKKIAVNGEGKSTSSKSNKG